MSLTASTAIQTPRPPGSQRSAVREFTFDNSYATGGESCTASDMGLKKIAYAKVFVVAGTESATVRVANGRYDVANEKIILIDNATGKEVESGKDMSKVVVLVEAVGY